MSSHLNLEEILKKHKHWIKKDCEGWEFMRANLREANLIGVNLNGANLSKADLGGAYLRGADLREANLRGTNLSGANISGADLKGANLSMADLSGADLSWVNLKGADLSSTDLRGANLSMANLSESNGLLMEYRKGKVITDPLIGYKKCKDDVIVTLEIPRGAIVFSINGDKCRTNQVKVIEIDGSNKAMSVYNDMTYYVGDEITVYDFDCEYNIECGKGIHFFMTRKEAENMIKS